MRAEEIGCWQVIHELVKRYEEQTYAMLEFREALIKLLEEFAKQRIAKADEERQKMYARLSQPRPQYEVPMKLVNDSEVDAIIDACKRHVSEITPILAGSEIDESYRRRVLRWVWDRVPQTKPKSAASKVYEARR